MWPQVLRMLMWSCACVTGAVGFRAMGRRIYTKEELRKALLKRDKTSGGPEGS